MRTGLTYSFNKDTQALQYFTDIEFGNPQRYFKAAIDIGFSDTFVPPSIAQILIVPTHNLYGHFQSSSYQKNGTAVRMHYAASTPLDMLQWTPYKFGDLIIENQAFEEATLLKVVPFWDDAIESVLGLPRNQVDDPESSFEGRQPFPQHDSTSPVERKYILTEAFSTRLP